MGRAFEFRKERKFKRWGHMARVFTKIGKEITIAVKQGGPDVTGNPRLRALIQTARSENMPKDNIERAIKRATDKDQADYKEVVFEGYGPHGIAVLVEAATDNNNRTVANVRSYFTKSGGSLGTSGSVDYMFDRKCMFRMKTANPYDLEELELELIDYGVEEIFDDITTIPRPSKHEEQIGAWLIDFARHHSLDFRTDEVNVGRNHMKSCNFCLNQGVADVDVSDHHFVKRSLLVIVRGKVKTGCGVSLRIRVNDQYLLFEYCKRCRKVNGCGSLSHAALLICYCYNLSHINFY